jgi:hypothetical protein
VPSTPLSSSAGNELPILMQNENGPCGYINKPAEAGSYSPCMRQCVQSLGLRLEHGLAQA